MGIYLIRFKEDKGIVKCKHTEKENTIKLLRSIKSISSNKLNIETVGTSGTIKSLIKKHMTDF
jgi:RNase P/RNase MRP subunit POP5